MGICSNYMVDLIRSNYAILYLNYLHKSDMNRAFCQYGPTPVYTVELRMPQREFKNRFAISNPRNVAPLANGDLQLLVIAAIG